MFIIGFFFLAEPSYGEEQIESVDFSVDIVRPENQRNENVTYFDLSVTPAFKQQLEIQITNNSAKEIKVQYEITNARSTMNKIIDYSPSKAQLDPSLKVPLTSIVTPVEKQQDITVPANEKKSVFLQVKTPEKLQNGVILGGIHFSLKKEDGKNTNSESKSKSTVVNNTYALVKGIQLTNGVLEPANININKASVFKFHRKPVVLINVQNDKPALIWNLSVKTIVKEKGKSQVLLEKEVTDIQMAPNTNVEIPFDWVDEKIPPGTYTALVEATLGKKKWKETLEFTVTADESEKTQLDASEKIEVKESKLILYLAIFGLILLLIGLTAYLIYTKKKMSTKKED